MQKVKLAELLLRRKELAGKVEQTRAVEHAKVFDTVIQSKQVTENLDVIIAKVPKLTLSQVTEEHDHYARSLRLVDAAIQQCNWTTEVDIDPRAMRSFNEYKSAIEDARKAISAATDTNTK